MPDILPRRQHGHSGIACNAQKTDIPMVSEPQSDQDAFCACDAEECTTRKRVCENETSRSTAFREYQLDLTRSCPPESPVPVIRWRPRMMRFSRPRYQLQSYISLVTHAGSDGAHVQAQNWGRYGHSAFPLGRTALQSYN